MDIISTPEGNMVVCRECRGKGVLPIATALLSGIQRDGRAIWKLLHELADMYSDRPTEFTQIAERIFHRVVPCAICSKKSLDYLQSHPMTDPIRWMCDYHNKKNLELGKFVYPCPGDPTPFRLKRDDLRQTFKQKESNLVNSGYYLTYR